MTDRLKFMRLCAAEDNDLVVALGESGVETLIYNEPEAAVEAAGEGEGVLLLSDGYPTATLRVSGALISAARAKRLKLYIEYPIEVGEMTSGPAQSTRYERLFVREDSLFGGNPQNNSIMMVNTCWHRPIFPDGTEGILTLAKAAGYDLMAFELPADAVCAMDYMDERRDVLIATTALSRFVRARYSPTERWRGIWQGILGFLGCEVSLSWTPAVTLSYNRDEPLGQDAEWRALQDNINFLRSRMIGKVDAKPSVFEGYESAIDHDGIQYLRPVVRADCMGESAMALAYGGRLLDRPDIKQLSGDLISQTTRVPEFFHDDPNSSMYGLNNWYENGQIFYGDDNARMLLGALSVRSVLGDDRWDEKILKCVLANLRTASKSGLRHFALRAESFKDKTWMDYYNETLDNPSPHYEASLWAIYVWMYALTGIDELLTKAKSAVRITMARYPDKLKWQNSMTGEITRMLLPLAFLMRVDPCAEHEDYLRRAVSETMKYQVPCGAIRDAFGDLSLGKYPPPQSNEKYGTSETSTIQENGDPATDLLYTTNWAFIGLHEAALVLDDPEIKRAADKLADFMVRIQVRSTVHPELDGAWMRSFDYDKWEYWGSSADIGWSAWCVETGWVNAWITTTLALRRENRSMMDLSAAPAFTAIAQDIYKEMMTPREVREVDDSPAGSAMPGAE